MEETLDSCISKVGIGFQEEKLARIGAAMDIPQFLGMVVQHGLARSRVPGGCKVMGELPNIGQELGEERQANPTPSSVDPNRRSECCQLKESQSPMVPL